MLSFRIRGHNSASLLCSFLLTCTAYTLVELILQDVEQFAMNNNALKYMLMA